MQALISGEALATKPTASSVSWREPVEVASFGTASAGAGSENGNATAKPPQRNRPISGSTRGSGPATPTTTPPSLGLGEAITKNCQVENGSLAGSPGVPESVMIVPMEDVVTSAELGTRKVIRSRGRSRRPDEPAPFLSVDTLPVDMVVVDSKTPVSASVKAGGRPTSGPTGGRRYTGSPKKYQSQMNLNSSMNSSLGGRKTPQGSQYGQKQGSRPSSKTSSNAINYNSFFTHKNAAFLSGPPSLWSVGNKYWPHQNSPPQGRRGPSFPPVMVVEGNSSKPNQLVTQPFKHDVDAPLLTERSISPSQELKEKTLQAVRDVAKDLSKKNPPASPTRSGRLLKGKLKPLHTFKLQGPSIDECKGIQTEERPSYTPSQARMLQRKRELMSMLQSDTLYQRPMTQESFHHTSIASNLSEDRTNDVQSPMRTQDTVGDLPANVTMPQMSAFTRMPPNSLTSFGSASDGMSPVPPETLLVEVPTENNNEYIKSSYNEAGGNDAHMAAPPEASMSDYLNEGGAASILSDMVDKVKHSTQRVSEEVAEAVEGAFHQSMLVNSEPSFSRSETPANRSVVSDDGLFESASQRSVRFSDNDSFIDNEQSVDSGRGGVGPGSDVLLHSLRGTPVQEVDITSIRNSTPTQDDIEHKDSNDQTHPSTNNTQEQNQNGGNDREVIVDTKDKSESKALQQVELDQVQVANEQIDIQTATVQNVEGGIKELDQSVDDNVQTSERSDVKSSSPEDTEMGVTIVKDQTGDTNIRDPTNDVNKEPVQLTLVTEQSASTDGSSDVMQDEQMQQNDQHFNTDQDTIPVESTSKIDCDAQVDEEAGGSKVRGKSSIQQEGQCTVVVPKKHEDDNLGDEEQKENIVTNKPKQKQSADNTSNELSAINVESNVTETKVVDPEQTEQQAPVLPVETADADQSLEITEHVVSDKQDLSKTGAYSSSTSETSDENKIDTKEDQSNAADEKSETSEIGGESKPVVEKQKDEEEEESKEGESCNKDKDDDKKYGDDNGGSGSSGGGSGAGENGHSDNNNGGSDTMEDSGDKGGKDESGQGDGNHGNISHGNEESHDNNENYNNNNNGHVFNHTDKGPTKPTDKKVVKCWYGDLEDDVPEIEDSVLFCGICGLDEDLCVCPHSSVAPHRTQSGITHPTYKTLGTNESISSVATANRLSSAPGAMQGNQISSSDELSSSDNNIVLEYKALLGHEAGSGCFSSELTPRKKGSVKPSNVHFLLRGLPVAPSEAGLQEDRKEEDFIVDSGFESEQMDSDSLHGDDDEGLPKNKVSDHLNGADPSTLEVVAKPKTLSRPRSAKNKPSPLPAPFPPLCFRINVRPPAGKLFYFAYGVDMNPKRMATYLGSTVERRWGVLFGFKLKFNKRGSDVEAGGFPNIEFDPASSVEGCVYVMTPDQLKTLDMFMGSPQFYTHAMFPVWMSNCYQPEQFGVAQYCVAALTYIALDKWTHTDTSNPLSCHYSIDQCLKGSDLLTTDYIHHMKAQLVS